MSENTPTSTSLSPTPDTNPNMEDPVEDPVEDTQTDYKNEPIESFDDMNLEDQLLRGVYNYGFERPSIIQQTGIRPLMDKRDVIGQAQSGTGKTAHI